MTVKEFYLESGGSYEEAFGRLLKDERILKYLRMFTQATDYAEFINNLNNGAYDVAFRYIHNVKGVALNLALTPLANIASTVCEYYRHGEPTVDVTNDLKLLQEEYNKVINLIQLID